jgi:hypothetical protein
MTFAYCSTFYLFYAQKSNDDFAVSFLLLFFCGYTVEGLYCKRPIQCLASFEILTPHPLTARRFCTLRLWCGWRTHSLGGEGVGGQQFGRRQTLHSNPAQ